MTPKTKETSREEDLADLLDVCYSHYVYNETQSQIAELMGVSRAKVCKMIAKAKARGLFTININDPLQTASDLAERLVRRYDLRNARVVPVPRYGIKNVVGHLGQAAARLLQEMIRPHDVIGISGGAALYETVIHFPHLPVENATVVPLLNGYAETEASTRGTEIAFMIAEKIGAKIVTMPIPGLARTPEEALMFRNNPTVKSSMTWIRKCNIGLFGIGTANHDASLYKGGFLDDDLLLELRRENAIGCIGFSFFDADGNPCEQFNSRNIGWTLEDVRHIPIAIGISGGTPEKAAAVRASLLGRYIDILVTDQITAEILLKD